MKATRPRVPVIGRPAGVLSRSAVDVEWRQPEQIPRKPATCVHDSAPRRGPCHGGRACSSRHLGRPRPDRYCAALPWARGPGKICISCGRGTCWWTVWTGATKQRCSSPRAPVRWVDGGRGGPPVVYKVGPAPRLVRSYFWRRPHPAGSVRPQAATGRGWNEGTGRPQGGGHGAQPWTRGAARRDGKKCGAKGPQGVRASDGRTTWRGLFLPGGLPGARLSSGVWGLRWSWGRYMKAVREARGSLRVEHTPPLRTHTRASQRSSVLCVTATLVGVVRHVPGGAAIWESPQRHTIWRRCLAHV